MDEYINREAFKQKLIEKGFFPAIVQRALEEMPSEDVVAVVRCKECKYWGGVTYGQVCRKYSGADTKVCTDRDHYCSYGERKG